MSDLVCFFCGHGPHRGEGFKKCQQCECRAWLRTDVAVGRILSNLNNVITEEIPKTNVLLADLVELFAEVYPEAVARVDERRAERRAKLEAARAEAGGATAVGQEEADSHAGAEPTAECSTGEVGGDTA